MKLPSAESRQSRRGAVLVLAAVLMVVVFGFTAFSVDVGYISLTKQELQNAADSAVLAAAQRMYLGTAAADTAAVEVAFANRVATRPVVIVPNEDVEYGRWDPNLGFVPPGVGEQFNAVRVTCRLNSARNNELDLFFAPVIGHNSTGMAAQAIATFQPRDIMVVLDFSSSMNNDSEMKAFDDLGQIEVESNLYQIYTELGSPTFGSMQWNPVKNNDSHVEHVIEDFGLDSVTYPYPSGSWEDYINYVMDDDEVDDAGYEDSYGYLTLVQYWIAERAASYQTPDLWMTSQQPVTALKEGVSEFVNYINQSAPTDRVGLSVYTYMDASEAILESGLTFDLNLIETITWQRQPKHYRSGTNIGAGMRKARLELQSNSRGDADRLMVLMTDGQANLPNDPTDAANFVINEANLADAADIRIITISVGAAADTALMQQVADIADGTHFNVPGGQSVADYTVQLREVFESVAAQRHTKLTQ